MIEKETEYRAALYCRLSSDDAYLGESGSIQTQRALLTQYCKENNIPIYDIYADMYNRILIQCLPHGSVEMWLKQRLSADLSRLPKAFFFVS